MENPVKKKLENGEKVLGSFIGTYSPNLVEMMGYAGFDFVVIDDEHGAFSYSELENMIRTAESVNLVPIVRVSYDHASIQKALDRGAKGIQVPMVNRKEDAEEVVKKAKFPPIGTRGAAFSHRAARFGKDKGIEFFNAADENILIIVHIETLEAVENIEDILSVEGIDIPFIGTTDLSVNMGFKAEGPKHSKVQKVVSELYKKLNDKKIMIGTVAGNAEDAKQAFENGAHYVGVTSTSVILNAFEQVTHACR